MTKTLAVEWAQHGIAVNAVAPGIIRSTGTDRYPPELVEMSRQRTPAKRLGTPEEVAELCAYLASDAASFVTGETWYIDGGAHLWGDTLDHPRPRAPHRCPRSSRTSPAEPRPSRDAACRRPPLRRRSREPLPPIPKRTLLHARTRVLPRRGPDAPHGARAVVLPVDAALHAAPGDELHLRRAGGAPREPVRARRRATPRRTSAGRRPSSATSGACARPHHRVVPPDSGPRLAGALGDRGTRAERLSARLPERARSTASTARSSSCSCFAGRATGSPRGSRGALRRHGRGDGGGERRRGARRRARGDRGAARAARARVCR